jgi:hypothetical protein
MARIWELHVEEQQVGLRCLGDRRVKFTDRRAREGYSHAVAATRPSACLMRLFTRRGYSWFGPLPLSLTIFPVSPPGTRQTGCGAPATTLKKAAGFCFCIATIFPSSHILPS